MDQKRALLAIIVFVAGIALLWIFLAQGLLSLDVFRSSPVTLTGDTTKEEANSLTLYHTQNGTTHIYEGTIEMPTPCHRLSSSITTGGVSRTVKIKLAIAEPEEGIGCVQMMDSQSFSVSLTSSQLPNVALSLNDKETPFVITEKK